MIYNHFLIFVDTYAGGVRAYLKSQLAFLRSQGIRCSLITCCNGGSAWDDGFDNLLVGMDFSKRKSARQIRAILDQVAEFAGAQSPDIIHSHAYQGFPFAALLANQMQLPFISTSHGKEIFQSRNDKRWPRIYNRLHARTSINFAVSDHLSTLYREMTGGHSCMVLPNPISAPVGPIATSWAERRRRWFWAGRLDSEKIPGLFALLDLAAKFDLGVLDIFGDGCSRHLVEKQLRKRSYKTHVSLKGWEDRLTEKQLDYGVACGMGRVVLDAMAAGLPALLTGYFSVHGFVTRSNFFELAHSNFNGRQSAPISADGFEMELAALTLAPMQFELTDYIQSRYDSAHIWETFAKSVDMRAAPLHIICDRYVRLLDYRRNRRSDVRRMFKRHYNRALGRLQPWLSSGVAFERRAQKTH